MFCFKLAFAQNNALEFGQCYKIGVVKNGIQKIDGAFLKKNNVNLNSLNPKNIHIFGNGSGMLPQANNIKRPSELTENAIYLSGMDDGKFDQLDYLLFYGEAPNKILFDLPNRIISHQTNVYCDTTYYFLVINDKPGLRISNNEDNNINRGKIINYFDDYLYHEEDLKNINNKKDESGKSGREFWGEEISQNEGLSKIFDLKAKGILPNSVAKINSSLIGATYNDKSKFKVFFNEELVQEIETEPIYNYEYGAKGANSNQKNTFLVLNPSSQKLEIKLNSNSENYPLGYIDFFGLNVKRNLQYDDYQFRFRTFESIDNDFTTFLIKTNDPKTSIWDISNPLLPKNQLFTIENGSVFTAATKSQLKEYIVFSNNNLIQPSSFKKIANQNIRNYQSPNLLIITAKKFIPAAQKLADYRTQNDNLGVEVLDIEQVYNEFSSGMVDVTAIRDCAKHFYTKSNKKLKYLLLFADASFDIRNKDKDPLIQKILPDLIPTYQSYESLDNVKSFSSEDYFGFLEENEGEWPETEYNKDNHTLDIGIGRIPVRSIEEAERVVEKIIYYDSKQNTIGDWRTKIALTADDGDSNLHQEDSEDLAEILKKKGGIYTPEKIFVDAFPRLSGNTNGRLSPGTSDKIRDTFKKGALVFNYIGHGGIQNLSDEKILTREDIGNWQNINNMPLMLTATCQFGRYDNPGEVSGAEKAILNPNGGAIALLTTTRPVYSSTNKKINIAFYNAAFEGNNGATQRLGDILKATKNNSFDGVFNRNFTLLGDPSMKLAYPEHKIQLSKINNKVIFEKTDTLKALQTVTLEGQIVNLKDNRIKNDFDGQIDIKLFDKETKLQTRGNNANEPMKYGIYQDILFKGKATVKSGQFKVTFTIPKDIQYKYGKGRIEMYASSFAKNMDASGVFSDFVVGGAVDKIKSENTPPSISAYLNNAEYKNGSKTSKNPKLIAQIKSENGLNLNKAAIGHEVTALLDGKTALILNDYIKPIIDNNKEFELAYQFENLSLGQHILSLTIWDIYNNNTSVSLEFEVVENTSTKLISVSNFPNPVSDITKFEIEHDFIGENISANISILNTNGKIISENNYQFNEAESPLKISLPKKIFSKDIPKGVYPYSIKLKTENANKTAIGASKLIVID
jgi:hypothetical protein